MLSKNSLKKIAIPAVLLTAVSVGVFKHVNSFSAQSVKKVKSDFTVPKNPKLITSKGEPKLSLEKDEQNRNYLKLSIDSTVFSGGVINLIEPEQDINIYIDLIVDKADENNSEFNIPLEDILEASPTNSAVVLITLVSNTKAVNGDDGLQTGLQIHNNGNSLEVRALSDEETKKHFEDSKEKLNKEEIKLNQTI